MKTFTFRPKRYDFRIDAHDHLVLVYPLTTRAGDWAHLHVPAEFPTFHSALCVEPEVWQRMSRDILNAGLTIGNANRIGQEAIHA